MNKNIKPTTRQKRIVAELNRVIHSCNLYAGPSRFINAQVIDGEICLENLQTGNTVALASIGYPLRTGTGRPVEINWASFNTTPRQ